MNAVERQNLIERYLSGAMGTDESRSFLVRTEHDPELRRLLDADRVITSAIARDRASGFADATVPPQALVAALERSRIAASLPRAATLLGMKLSTIAVVVGIVGVIVGAFIVAPYIGTRDAARDVVTPSPATPGMVPPSATAPSAADRSEASSTDARDGAGSASDIESGAREAARDRVSSDATTTNGAALDARGSAGTRERSAARGADAATDGRSDRARTSSADDRSADDLPTYDDSSVKAEIELKEKNP